MNVTRAQPLPDRNVTLTIWATEAQRAQIARRAAECNMSRAQFLRMAVVAGAEKVLAEHRAKKAA